MATRQAIWRRLNKLTYVLRLRHDFGLLFSLSRPLRRISGGSGGGFIDSSILVRVDSAWYNFFDLAFCTSIELTLLKSEFD